MTPATAGNILRFRSSQKNPRAYLREVWEMSQDGMRITDEEGIIVDVNNRYCRMVGMSAAQLIGKPFTVAYADSEDADHMMTRYKQRFADGTFEVQVERTLRLDSGTESEVEVALSILNPEGRRMVLTQFRDIGQRKQVERELRKSEETYRQFFADAVQPMFRSTPEGRILEANAALLEMLGYSSLEEFRKVDLADLYAESLGREKVKHELADSGALRGLEFRLKRSDGTIIEVSERSRAIHDDRGNIVAYEGMLEEITVRKQLEESRRRNMELLEASRNQMADLNAQKDRFMSILSHDLRSPFASILGFCEILRTEKKELTEQERDQFIGFIDMAARDQLALVNKLLDWSRLESGRVKIDSKDLDLSAVVQRCMSGLGGLASQKKVLFINNLRGEMPVRADEQLLSQVFNNLLGNALKFTPAGGTIVVHTRPEAGNAWIVEVRDSGTGIPATDLPRLFRVEEKFSKPGIQGEKGTGMGLALVKEILQKHGGTIAVESKVGNGSSFIVSIPRRQQASTNEALLIVDDQEGVREVHARYLKRCFPQLSVCSAANGEEALQMIGQHNIQFVVTDYSMPVMNGESLIRELKKSPRGIRIPIIVITGVESDATVETLYQAGATTVLSKPVSQDQLSEAIRNACPFLTDNPEHLKKDVS